MYKAIVALASDGEIDAEDENRIKDLLLDGNFTEKQKSKAYLKSYKHAYKEVVSDNIVTEEEQKALDRIQSIFNIPYDKIITELENLYNHQIMRDMRNGIMPECNVGIIMKKDEVAHISITGGLVEEKTVSSGYKGGSAGVSFRVAKGVNLRVGQSRGKFVSEKAPVVVSNGYLIITNKRVVFDGDKKGFNYTYNQLIGFDVLDDSIIIKPTRGNPKLVKFDNDGYNADILDMCLQLSSSN